MRHRDTVYLVDTVTTEDSAGYEAAAERKTEVFADVRSVRREEFYRSRQAGMEPALAFVLRACDYGGQSRVEYEGKQYRVIRAYTGDGEWLELNCGPYRGETP